MSNVVNKQASQWTDEELAQWAKGEVETGPSTSVKAVAKEATARFKLEGGDVEAVKGQVLAMSEPDDEEQPEAHDSEEPVVADGPSVQTDADGNSALVFTQKPFDLNKESGVAVQPEGKKIVATKTAADIRRETTIAQQGLGMKLVEEGLKEYVNKMRPGVPHNGEEGPNAQAALYRVITNAFRQTGSDFSAAMGLLLSTVREHRKGAFNERYVFRYMDRVKLNAQERRNFERVINLLMATCEPATRQQGLKQVDLESTVSGFGDPNLIQKLTEYFSV